VACKSDFLPAERHRQLLDWTLANSERFRPATVASRDGTIVDPADRVAFTTRELGSELDWLHARFEEAFADLRTQVPTSMHQVRHIELELAAHGDGAHFAPHVDVPVGKRRQPLGTRPDLPHDRLLSAVYYYHSEPKRFDGGNLRLYRFGFDPQGSGTDRDSFVEFEPSQNSLVAFPTWALHEVREVRCPSREFRDFRFAVNCWYCGGAADDLEPA
jgi:Rps23 Pro-64 3,4-dihydroxylase Tpa1-like proline 4-hydroxylase